MSTRSPDDTDKSVGTRVRMERLAAGMSQQSLGEVLGVSFQQIQKYEKGLNRISAGRIRQICDALRIPFESLVGSSDVETLIPNETLRDIQQFLATRDGLALMLAFRAIESDLVKRELISLIREIAGSGAELQQILRARAGKQKRRQAD